MARFEIGPPSSGGFPIGSLFLVLVMVVSLGEIYLLNALSPFVVNLAFASLGTMFLYVLFGKALSSLGGIGQALFIGLGATIFFFGDLLRSTFSIHFALIQLSYFGPLSVTWNGADVTGWFALFLVASIAFVVWNEWKNRKH
jgi:hypothetical protein